MKPEKERHFGFVRIVQIEKKKIAQSKDHSSPTDEHGTFLFGHGSKFLATVKSQIPIPYMVYRRKAMLLVYF